MNKKLKPCILQERYHIFANEAMQAICSVKPKYDYFVVQAVSKYLPVINEGNNIFRLATEDEINWEVLGAPEPNFADDVDTKKMVRRSKHILIKYSGTYAR